MLRPRHTPFSATFLFLVALLVSLISNVVIAQSGAKSGNGPEPGITQVNGNLYRFVHNNRAGVFLVTDRGIIVGDPLDMTGAKWLKDELTRRFDQTVKYVFYSRLSAERASGASVFTEGGAIVIAHQNSAEKSVPSVPAPGVTFTDRLTIRLGSGSVDLIYPGKSLTDDLVVAHFPDENAVYAADIVSVERLPKHSLVNGFFPDWFAAVNRLTRLDFVYLLPASGKIGIRNDAVEYGYYLRELHNRVKRAVPTGISQQVLAETLEMPQYQRWDNYTQQLPHNVSDMYQIVTRQP